MVIYCISKRYSTPGISEGQEAENMSGIFLYSYEQMQAEINELLQRYPGKLYRRSIGLTADKRELTEVLLGNPGAPFHFLIQAAMHGREYLNSALVVRQMAVCAKEGVSEEVCFHILPMVNPDGASICQEGAAGIRRRPLRAFLEQCFQQKYAEWRSAGLHTENDEGIDRERFFRRWKANALGVDLNRNFPDGWEKYQGASGPCGEGYKGLFPFSEPETKAIRRLLGEYPFTGSIAYHSSGNLIYWHYGSKGKLLDMDRRLAEGIARLTGYALCSTEDARTDGAGCSDHLMLTCRIPSVTIETGGGPCPLDAGELPEILRRNRDVWREMEKALLTGEDCHTEWCGLNGANR